MKHEVGWKTLGVAANLFVEAFGAHPIEGEFRIQQYAMAALFSVLEPATSRLGRVVNATVYSRIEFEKRVRGGNAFVKRMVAQPRLWVIGQESDLTA